MSIFVTHSVRSGQVYMHLFFVEDFSTSDIKKA